MIKMMILLFVLLAVQAQPLKSSLKISTKPCDEWTNINDLNILDVHELLAEIKTEYNRVFLIEKFSNDSCSIFIYNPSMVLKFPVITHKCDYAYYMCFKQVQFNSYNILTRRYEIHSQPTSTHKMHSIFQKTSQVQFLNTTVHLPTASLLNSTVANYSSTTVKPNINDEMNSSSIKLNHSTTTQYEMQSTKTTKNAFVTINDYSLENSFISDKNDSKLINNSSTILNILTASLFQNMDRNFSFVNESLFKVNNFDGNICDLLNKIAYQNSIRIDKIIEHIKTLTCQKNSSHLFKLNLFLTFFCIFISF
jgi:hypothetical protein